MVSGIVPACEKSHFGSPSLPAAQRESEYVSFSPFSFCVSSSKGNGSKFDVGEGNKFVGAEGAGQKSSTNFVVGAKGVGQKSSTQFVV